ncbi:hypothetical protein J2W52_005842 [Rhizobium miluonense]|uniref:Secreted protein n=1 Tax=Rhizobium miluonense TaxID=411945 RepID=A0ABU1SZ86_9HYPH|nr:hypothetical protein [Rhizobium miluonense]
MVGTRLIAAAACSLMLSTMSATACDQTVTVSNWKSCAVGPLGATAGMSDWNAVPQWVRDDKIKPYFFGDPRLLALHGLCNVKFHRVVLCLPGWQESNDKDACWYMICSGHQASRG